MGVFAFSAANFKLRYPEFATLGDDLLGMYFTEACMYCDNTSASIISSVTMRGVILNALTAHVAALVSAAMSGRVSSASEGNVSVSTDMGPPSLSRAWFFQTKYGASAYQMMAPYRCAFYVPPQNGPCLFITSE